MNMDELETSREKTRQMPVMKYAMWACCVVMLLPVAAFVMAGGLSGSLSSGLYASASLRRRTCDHASVDGEILSWHGKQKKPDRPSMPRFMPFQAQLPNKPVAI